MKIATDTATLALFDTARLTHRLAGPADWWTWPPDVLGDLNTGNVFPVDLGGDGVFEVTVHLDVDRPATADGSAVSGRVGCDSGRLFIGPGEQISGGGQEPDASLGGVYLPCPVGVYRVWVAATDVSRLVVWLEQVVGPAVNHFTDLPRIT